jgi:signal-transduction protein with cAMP-binding, CBS, and nucleotidyltransferase domain
VGNLKPGATYIYERNGEEIYARETGQTDRVMIGYQYENKVDPRTHDGRPLYEHMMEDKLWGEIRLAARTNKALQKAMERVKLVYHLSKEHGKK